MNSLRQRERITADSIAAAPSRGSQKPGAPLPGILSLLLSALFILSFCCRYCQVSLLSGIQLAGPGSQWWAPSGTLLLLPAAVVAIPIGLIAARAGKQVVLNSPALLACALALINVLLGINAAPGAVLTLGVILATLAMEATRVTILTQITNALSANRRRTGSVGGLIVFLELAATASGIATFKTLVETTPLSESLRLTALFLICASFLLYWLKDRRNDSDVAPFASHNQIAAPSPPEGGNLKTHAFSIIFLTAVANTSVLTITCLAIADRTIASTAAVTYWLATAVGALAGCLFCLLPIVKTPGSKWYLSATLAAVSSAVCIFKPAGEPLVIALLLSGFAASLANISCYNQIIKWRALIAPGILFGCQSALSCLVAFAVNMLLEPRIEAVSVFVFVRAMAIAQLSLLIISGIIWHVKIKYLRNRP